MDVVDTDERDLKRPSEGFGGRESDKEGADEAGAVAYGNGVDLIKGCVGFGKRLFDDG